MLKKAIIFSCFMLMCIIFAGCSDSLKDENEKLKNEIVSKDSRIAELEGKLNELELQDTQLKALIKSKELFRNHKEEKLSKNINLYAVYTANDYTYDKEIYFWIYISENNNIKQRLDILANALSQTIFDKLPIEIVKIEEKDGKRIAIVNLMESKENQGLSDYSLFKGKSWATGYFQGSTGGNITSTSLIETFLQRQYSGEWIDGVRFMYNNGKEGNWADHAPRLGEVNYRK